MDNVRSAQHAVALDRILTDGNKRGYRNTRLIADMS
jgi:hypothetical protein